MLLEEKESRMESSLLSFSRIINSLKLWYKIDDCRIVDTDEKNEWDK